MLAGATMVHSVIWSPGAVRGTDQRAELGCSGL